MRKKNKNAGGPAIPLEEKIDLLYGDGNWKTHGSPTLNLSGVVMRDGPLGLRDIDDSGMLDGAKTNKATCYPGFEQFLTGATVTGELVTIDRNIITGKGPAAAIPFATAIIAQIAGEEKAKEVRAAMLL